MIKSQEAKPNSDTIEEKLVTLKKSKLVTAVTRGSRQINIGTTNHIKFSSSPLPGVFVPQVNRQLINFKLCRVLFLPTSHSGEVIYLISEKGIVSTQRIQ